MNVNRFGSRITVLNANDATVYINTTASLGDFYGQWNLTSHQQQQTGLNLPNVLRQLRTFTQQQLDFERTTSSVGGRSLVTIIVPQMSGINEAEGNFAVEQVQILREQVPDLHLLFFTGGSQTRFERFVREPQRDLFPLQALSSGIESAQQLYVFVQPVVKRIEQSKYKIISRYRKDLIGEPKHRCVFCCLSRRHNNSIVCRLNASHV